MNVFISAGDAVTAKLVQEAGFDGIWVSGFEVATRMGLPDNGSITMTEMLNVCKPIVEAVNIPVWVDTDTGYGNFRRTVTEFEKIGVDGVCVEDVVPEQKQNSLWEADVKLMSKEDFAKKIKVGRNKIKVIARTEAIVRGYGENEAVNRLIYYLVNGNADILLPHTRDITEIYYPGCSKYNWAIVPTKFPRMTNAELNLRGYDYIIWANQTERVKIKAIREALRILKADDCAVNIENKLSATLDDMKGLVDG